MKTFFTAKQLRELNKKGEKMNIFDLEIKIKKRIFHEVNGVKYPNSIIANYSNQVLTIDVVEYCCDNDINFNNFAKNFKIGQKIIVKIKENWNVHYSENDDFCFRLLNINN